MDDRDDGHKFYYSSYKIAVISRRLPYSDACSPFLRLMAFNFMYAFRKKSDGLMTAYISGFFFYYIEKAGTTSTTLFVWPEFYVSYNSDILKINECDLKVQLHYIHFNQMPNVINSQANSTEVQDDGVTLGMKQPNESCPSAPWGICWAHGFKTLKITHHLRFS